MNEWFLGGFFLSICCWLLSETGAWACWTRALVSNKCYFLKNFENPLSLWSREGGGSCMTGLLWCIMLGPRRRRRRRAAVPHRALMLPHAGCLPPRTDGCTSFLSATPHHPLDLLREAAWANGFSSIVLKCQGISVERGGCSITLMFWRRAGSCAERWSEVHYTPPWKQNVWFYL